MTTAMMRVGTRVETRPESEEDPPLRAEPTFESVCGNMFQLGDLEGVERRRDGASTYTFGSAVGQSAL